MIIPAAGRGVRWRHYHQDRAQAELDGYNKHFAVIGGETILGRLVRLFRERGVDDIWIVGPDESYQTDGARLFIPQQVPEHYDANKVLNSASLWKGRTVVFYGDVYLTDEGCDAVLAEKRPWVAVGRSGLHRWTNHPEELFGFIISPKHFARSREVLHHIADLRHNGKLKRCAGWEFYWGWNGDPKAWQTFPETWLEVDDLTDDVDTPAQYRALKEAVECSGQS